MEIFLNLNYLTYSNYSCDLCLPWDDLNLFTINRSWPARFLTFSTSSCLLDFATINISLPLLFQDCAPSFSGALSSSIVQLFSSLSEIYALPKSSSTLTVVIELTFSQLMVFRPTLARIMRMQRTPNFLSQFLLIFSCLLLIWQLALQGVGQARPKRLAEMKATKNPVASQLTRHSTSNRTTKSDSIQPCLCYLWGKATR